MVTHVIYSSLYGIKKCQRRQILFVKFKISLTIMKIKIKYVDNAKETCQHYIKGFVFDIKAAIFIHII